MNNNCAFRIPKTLKLETCGSIDSPPDQINKKRTHAVRPYNLKFEIKNSAQRENFCDKRAQSQTRLNYAERNKNLA